MIVKLKMHPAGKTLGKTCNYKLLQINFQINFFFLICGLQSKERQRKFEFYFKSILKN